MLETPYSHLSDGKVDGAGDAKSETMILTKKSVIAGGPSGLMQ
jgi:hypothetical protein